MTRVPEPALAAALVALAVALLIADPMPSRPREPVGAPAIVAPTPPAWAAPQGYCVCEGRVVVPVPALEVPGLTRDCSAACRTAGAGK